MKPRCGKLEIDIGNYQHMSRAGEEETPSDEGITVRQCSGAGGSWGVEECVNYEGG